MLVLTCCQSKPAEPRIIIQYEYKYPVLYFPKFPEPGQLLVPLNVEYKRVTTENEEVVYVMMPYWYFQRIVDYKQQIDLQKTYYDTYVNGLNSRCE